MRFKLSEWPDHGWIAAFRAGDFPNDLEEPTFEGSGPWLLATVAKPDLARYIEALKARIEATNQEFAEKVLPQREREAESAAAKREASERELAEVRQQIEDLL